MINMIESRVIGEHLWRQWEPHIIYVFHQTSPPPTRIWLPPFSEPVGFDAPYIMSREVNMIGMAIAEVSMSMECRAPRTWVLPTDAWYAGYVDYAPIFENIRGVLDGNSAATVLRPPSEYSEQTIFRRSIGTSARKAYTPVLGNPGWWRLGDAVAYDETAALSGCLSWLPSTRSRCYTTVIRRDETRSQKGRDRPLCLFHPAGSA